MLMDSVRADPVAASSVDSVGDRPLTGYGVVVTRDEPVDGPLSSRLRALGAEVWSWPTVRIERPEDATPLRRAVRNLETYDWIVFSSQHAVTAVTAMRRQCPSTVRVAAVGSATADALRLAGWPVTVTPDAHGGDHLVVALEQRDDLAGRHILYPASAIARPTIRSDLGRCGAQVDQVTAYGVRSTTLDPTMCLAAVERGAVHAITFASPSALDGFQRALGSEPSARVLRALAVVVIGPTTAAALATVCDRAPFVASPSTLDALANSVTVALHEKE
jgi:uroporphyrinogen-III synthase